MRTDEHRSDAFLDLASALLGPGLGPPEGLTHRALLAALCRMPKSHPSHTQVTPCPATPLQQETPPSSPPPVPPLVNRATPTFVFAAQTEARQPGRRLDRERRNSSLSLPSSPTPSFSTTRSVSPPTRVSSHISFNLFSYLLVAAAFASSLYHRARPSLSAVRIHAL
ncbi:hypothetical protein BDN71DRAFT_1507370 [Pleurotus eryngii]|uniref:Uncharacterized protein n=1 Tax=Pleurotus eryngii TaxID=5323 RepID=A0A9P5ZZR1_PLEER|nr:hypothetical protein BDN71DRAFT_1507370 [Pleurotus eryngii]